MGDLIRTTSELESACAQARADGVLSLNKQRILLLTPPLLQTNTPYPATMHLTGFLESKGVDVHQRDLSIKVVCYILL